MVLEKNGEDEVDKKVTKSFVEQAKHWNWSNTSEAGKERGLAITEGRRIKQEPLESADFFIIYVHQYFFLFTKDVDLFRSVILDAVLAVRQYS